MAGLVRRTIGFAVVFALSIAVGRATLLPATGLALFWPAAGVAALWALAADRRREVLLVGGLVSAIAAVGNAVTGFAAFGAVLLGLANGVIPLVVRFGLDGLRGAKGADAPTRNGLTRLANFYVLVVVGFVAAVASTGLGMMALAGAGRPVSWTAALAYGVRNFAAVIIIAAPGLAVLQTRDTVTRRDAAEATVLGVLTAAVLWAVFGPGHTLPLAFVPFALVLWAGLRLPVRLAVGEGLFVALGTFALVRGYQGGQLGTIADPTELSLSVQAYMTMAVGLAVVLAIVQWERDRLLRSIADVARTSRHQAEDLAVITSTMPDGLFVIDRDGTILLHNEAARRWLDAGGEEGAATSSKVLVKRQLDGAPIPEEELPSARALRGESVRGAMIQAEDLETGEVRTVSVDAVPLHDGDAEGPPDRALLVYHDVSEEQERIRALEAERTRTERLISDAPHGVAVLDMAGRILQINDSLAAMAGLEAEGLVGVSIDDLSPHHREKIGIYLARAVQSPGELLVGDWTIENPHGEEAHVSLTSRVLTGVEESDDVILVNVVDFSERRRYEEKLAHLADHDALTGLPNRRRFDEALDRHLQHCQRNGHTGALLLVDLDHFKEVNDTMGHDAGDQLIVSIADLLRDTLRASDLVARLGGDEFAVLLPEADREGAQAVAEVIVQRVRAHSATLDGVKRRVTASVGVITFAAAAQQAVDPLALADMLMYDAKEAGRNQHVILDEDGQQQPRTGARLEWTARIEAALESDAFQLYLQPIVDVRTNRVTGAEALVRLVDRGVVVSPARFVHVAERAGLAPELDRWVVRHAIETLSRLHALAPGLTLDLNISGHSISDPSVEEELVDALRRYGVPPQTVVVEITETAAVGDVAGARAFAERLGALGTRVAIDDFGAGFGSFYYLKHLRFDVVKIDGEFVAEAHTSAVDRAILRSIVGIARNLGKRTVAEFVSESAVLDVVRDLEVDYAQGYLIGEPVPFDEFVAKHLAGGSGAWTTEGEQPATPPRLLRAVGQAG